MIDELIRDKKAGVALRLFFSVAETASRCLGGHHYLSLSHFLLFFLFFFLFFFALYFYIYALIRW